MIKCSIQCVPERDFMVTQIQEKLTLMGIEHKAYFDYEHNGPMWNFNRIISDYEYYSGDILLVLQDDVIFQDGFKEHLLDVIQYMNNHDVGAVSLFCPPRKKYIDEAKKGTIYYVERDFLWMPSIMFSTKYATQLSRFNHETKHDDVFVRNFASKTKQYVHVTIPSLIQHNLEIKSTLGTAPKIGSIVRESPLFYKVKSGHYAK